MATKDIFGRNLGSTKTPCCQPVAIDTQVTPVPPDMLSKYKHITLAVNVVYVNDVPLLLTVAHHLNFTTTAHLKDKSVEQLVAGIKHARDAYRSSF
jgi:hypothetical protein